MPAFLERQISLSDLVYFELDLLNDDVNRKILDCQQLSHGEHLKEQLPEQLYRRLKTFFRTKRNEVNDKVFFDLLTKNWKVKRLIWVCFMISFLIENDGYYRIPTVDNLINQRAALLHKTVRSIETVDDQCKPVNSLDSKQVIQLLSLTLDAFDETAQSNLIKPGNLTKKADSLRKQKSPTDLLIEKYKCGQLNIELGALLEQELKDYDTQSNLSLNDESKNRTSGDKIATVMEKMESINRFFQKQLIEKRNKKMTETIRKELKRNADSNMLFVIGAAHFLGPNSILKILEVKHGYQTEKVDIRNIPNPM